jgi:hypothetical protein
LEDLKVGRRRRGRWAGLNLPKVREVRLGHASGGKCKRVGMPVKENEVRFLLEYMASTKDSNLGMLADCISTPGVKILKFFKKV